MTHWKLAAAAVTLLAVSGAHAAYAGVVFSDNFNSYNAQGNWTPPANWSVTSGSVDLIGETPSGTTQDPYPGNGGYVDLNGTSGAPGALQTLASFGPGTYTLTFDLGGNALGDPDKTTEVTLGDFSNSIKLNSSVPLMTESLTFTTATGGHLSFADLAGPGNANIGNMLDNVTLTSAAPEPSTWALLTLGFGGLGAAMRGQRRKLASVA